MPKGIYVRTAEVKAKQSAIMKIRTQSYDWEQNKRKAKETFLRNGTKHGRPISLEERVCPQCLDSYQPVRVVQVYCTATCYHKTKEGKPVSTTESLKTRDRSYMQTEAYRSKKRKETTPAYRKYRNRVATLTERSYVTHQNDINPNNHPRTLAGVEGGYQLDHKIAVRHGFDQGLSEEVISDKDNLRMLPWRDNLMKWFNKE